MSGRPSQSCLRAFLHQAATPNAHCTLPHSGSSSYSARHLADASLMLRPPSRLTGAYHPLWTFSTFSHQGQDPGQQGNGARTGSRVQLRNNRICPRRARRQQPANQPEIQDCRSHLHSPGEGQRLQRLAPSVAWIPWRTSLGSNRFPQEVDPRMTAYRIREAMWDGENVAENSQGKVCKFAKFLSQEPCGARSRYQSGPIHGVIKGVVPWMPS